MRAPGLWVMMWRYCRVFALILSVMTKPCPWNKLTCSHLELSSKPAGFHWLCVPTHTCWVWDWLTHTSCIELAFFPSINYHWSFSHLHHTCHIATPRAAQCPASVLWQISSDTVPASELCRINSLHLITLLILLISLDSCIWSFSTIVRKWTKFCCVIKQVAKIEPIWPLNLKHHGKLAFWTNLNYF